MYVGSKPCFGVSDNVQQLSAHLEVADPAVYRIIQQVFGPPVLVGSVLMAFRKNGASSTSSTSSLPRISRLRRFWMLWGA
jgi:hypothetical protein